MRYIVPDSPQSRPHAFQIGRVDEEHISGENVPLKHRDVQRVFQKKVEAAPENQKRVAELLHPEQRAQREF
jgi:hypothetical protein